jgi:UDP-N-acetylmuramate dehydrogenase
MNAGAYDGELKDVVTGVTLMDKKGNIFKMSGEEMDFSYRDSLAQRMNYIVLEVELQLQKSDYDKIWQKIDDFSIRRWSKQPLEFPSGGSTFKRPQGYYAGKLIQDAGLKGLRFRGAQVSPKHSGFIINVDNASCEDVRTLIRLVQKRVKDEYGIELEAELRLINDEIKG